MGGKCRVFIVEDHPIVRRGITDLIDQQSDLMVCGETGDASAAIEQLTILQPDLAVIDLSLENGHGLWLIEQVRLASLPTRMLVFSMHDEALFAERVLRAGAMGYLHKHESPERLLAAVRDILAGQLAISPAIAGRLLHRVTAGETGFDDPLQTLTNRELQIFGMIGEGMPTKSIAARLRLSRKTVEAHRERIKGKLNLSNSTELSRRAVQWALETR